MIRKYLQLLVIASLCIGSITLQAKNGFDLSNASIPVREIKRGGPAKDGIVALSNPTMIEATETSLLPSAPLLGLVVNGQARAYPVAYLNIHEVINDAVGAQHYAVTFCPLCGSGLVFATNVADSGQHLNFGVSGLLYNSDLLMYDRNTDSLWSQLEGTAVSGPLVGTELGTLPVLHTTWARWQQQHPDTLVMAGDKRFRRLYRRDPYPGYTSNRRLLFAVKHKAPDTYHPKEPVLGIQLGGQAQAYPFVELRRAGLAEHTVTLAGRTFTVRWDADSETAWAEDAQGNPMTATRAFWFAWYAFHPDTHVYSAPDRN